MPSRPCNKLKMFSCFHIYTNCTITALQRSPPALSPMRYMYHLPAMPLWILLKKNVTNFVGKNECTHAWYLNTKQGQSSARVFKSGTVYTKSQSDHFISKCPTNLEGWNLHHVFLMHYNCSLIFVSMWFLDEKYRIIIAYSCAVCIDTIVTIIACFLYCCCPV